MYYPRFTKLVVNFVMAKDPSIPRRNKVNWHYARDDPMFTTINVISRNEDTQLYGTILPVALTNEDICNSESYKEYYAIASGKIPPKTKASKKKADFDAPLSKAVPHPEKEKKEGKERLAKGKQKAKELETISEAVLTEAEQLKIIIKRSRKETHSSHASGSGADEGSSVSSSDDEDSDNEVEGMDVEGEKSDEDATYVEDQGNEVDRDTNANLEGRDDVKTDLFYIIWLRLQHAKSDAIFRHNAQATSLIDIPVTAIAEPSFFAPTNHPPTPTPLFIQLQQSPILTPTTTPSSSLQNLPDFASLFGFDNRLKALGDNFSKFKQTNQYAEALSSILGIVDQYLANNLKEAVDVVVQLKSDRI
ncbi:hypothetical protein Tco_1147614 [Tanacetum coccineum]